MEAGQAEFPVRIYWSSEYFFDIQLIYKFKFCIMAMHLRSTDQWM